MKIRQSYFAGSWYPLSRSACTDEIKSYIDERIKLKSDDIKKISGIVPHAGWVFSGEIACNVIRILGEDKDCDTIIVLGGHMRINDKNIMMKEGYWDTPVGELKIDSDISYRLDENFDFFIETPTNFQPDNTIELQLPFIKYFFDDVSIVPIAIAPRTEAFEIIDFIVDNFKDKRIKFIGSTDLTHYGPNYGFTPKGVGEEAVEWVKNENDKKIIDVMLKMDENGIIEEAIENRNVCCPGAAASAIYAAKREGAKKGELLIYNSSYDKSPASSFVGYAGLIF